MCASDETQKATGSPSLFARLERLASIVTGVILTANFGLMWGPPLIIMGQAWKLGFSTILMPFYNAIDNNKALRSFGEEYVYVKKEYVDYFAISLIIIANCTITIGFVFWYQLSYGYLPWYVIAAYYCSWVGIGGRVMGAAYTLAHREGHRFTGIYQKWLQNIIGNFFENSLGCFFGNVPYNFTTSHVFIHHRLDAGLGDSFYAWDLDRRNLLDFMVYQQRILLHMVGYSSLKFFRANEQMQWADLLQKGIYTYFGVALAIMAITKSPAFVFWIYIQPLFCMTYFLALINMGFHGFIEFDNEGKHIPYVNSCTIIEGDDDYFGEDDHMAHHYAGHVFHRNLPEHQKGLVEQYKKYRASVFRGLSIAELSIFMIFGVYDKLAEHYVDYNGDLTHDEIVTMLKTRASRTEITNLEYNRYLSHPTPAARKALQCLDWKAMVGQTYLPVEKRTW